MRSQPSFLLNAACAFLVAVCAAAQVGEIIAQEESSPADLRHGYRMMFFDEEGREMTWEQFQTYDGQSHWEIRGAEPVSDHARMLYQNGRKAAARGRHAAAVELFQDAYENAPGWLYPIYELAWTHLLAGDAEEAERQYHRINRLEPNGFLNSPQAEHCLKLERKGEVTAGTYQRVLMAAGASRETAIRVLRSILDEYPRYAVAWSQLAGIADDAEEAREAIDNGLASGPDPFTRDELRIRQAIITHNEGRPSVAVKMLERLLRDPELTLAAEAQTKVLLPGMRRELKASGQSSGKVPAKASRESQ